MKKILIYILFIPIYCCAYIVPKKSNLWVFGAWFGKKYSDNPRAVFEYVISENKKIEAVWIAKDTNLFNKLNSAGVNVKKATSLAGLWFQYRAEVAILTHSVQSDFFAPCISSGTKRVQLWHGISLKKIGYNGHLERDKGIKLWLKTWIFPFLSDHFDLVCASSDTVAEVFAVAFHVSPSRVKVTGEACCDRIVKSAQYERKKDFLKVLYAPTFRGDVSSEFDFFKEYISNIDKLDRQLGKETMQLGIRPHPVNIIPKYIIDRISKSENIYFENTDELNDVIWKYDALLTDFSSVMFEFSLLKRPIYFMPLDLDSYLKNDRSLNVSYEEFTQGHIIDGWQDFENTLSTIANQLRADNELVNKQVANYGFKYLDDKSSERVYQEILKLLSGNHTND